MGRRGGGTGAHHAARPRARRGGPLSGSRRAGHLVASAALLALAAYVFVEAGGYPDALQPGQPGPAFFPRLLAVALGGLAAVLGAQALAGRTRVGDAPGREGLGKVGAAVALVAAFVASLHVGGVFLTLPALLAAVMALMGERRIVALVAVPLLFDLFVYTVFYRFFSVDLPTVLF